MIIPGRVALSRKVITNIRSTVHQVQPCGIDLTLKRVLTWASSGTIDFSNTHRKTAQTVEIPYQTSQQQASTTSPWNKTTEITTPGEFIHLATGSYLIEFNEQVDMPLDLMGQILVRSSLFRSGALVSAGVMDLGYKGPVGAMLQVVNPHGLRLMRDAKCAQMVFHEMSEPVEEGYSGVYQGRAFA
ncbi:putative dUTP diphosphatase Dut [Clathrospora elynae]|uniref:Putative dUTP diphosphatase Dut n=1 Tax=Clathrospora elynae TaxID=706981 RepID=A0A6A5SAF9_9PLEO|nr:putative dUTP diphosphatase Dut [Clathrospora elynae]